MTRIVVLLAGPPGAGKTTAAHESGLTVYDRDDDRWQSDRQFNDALTALSSDPDARAVVIRSGATATARTKAANTITATHTYVLLADPQELKSRIRHRRRSDLPRTIKAVDLWLTRFNRDDNVADFPGWVAVAETDDTVELWTAT